MSKVVLLTVAIPLLITASASSTWAFTYSESGDAGQTLPTAQAIGPGTAQDPNPTQILGTLDPTNSPSPFGDADIFSVSLTQGTPFAGVVTFGTTGQTAFGSNFYLFDSAGKGITAITGGQTNIPINFTPTVSGTYYLAISNSSYFPVDSNFQPIFSNFFGVTPPNTNAGPLFTWLSNSSFSNGIGSYNVLLNGASPVAVPEPAIGGSLFALSLLGLAAARRRKRQIAE